MADAPSDDARPPATDDAERRRARLGDIGAQIDGAAPPDPLAADKARSLKEAKKAGRKGDKPAGADDAPKPKAAKAARRKAPDKQPADAGDGDRAEDEGDKASWRPWHEWEPVGDPERDGYQPGPFSKHAQPGSGLGLPIDCPFTAMGVDAGTYYFLDERKQLRDFREEKLNRSTILSLCGAKASAYPYRPWPRVSDKFAITGWRAELAQEQAIAAAARRGVWSPRDRARGRGMWRTDDGRLVLHVGDQLFVSASKEEIAGGADPYVDGVWIDPGVHGDYVYPAGPSGMRPWPVKTTKGDLLPLLKLVQQWPFKRADIDPLLALGWMASARLSGAIAWRPLLWLTGGAGTGKSFFQQLLKTTFGRDLLATTDATAAGLYQTIKYDALPVAHDELESEAEDARAQAVIKLARHSASGGSTHRGGKDGDSSNFTGVNSFLFSSILIPPLTAQDRSRMAILELNELQRGAPPPDVQSEAVQALGRKLIRRIIDRWADLDDRLFAFHHALVANGHSQRGATQFGTLLAMADILLNDEPPTSDEFEEMSRHVHVDLLAETDKNETDQMACLHRLLAYRPDVYRSGVRVGLVRYIQTVAGELRTMREGAEPAPEDFNEAQQVLTAHGLRVVGRDDSIALAVANRHPELAKVYDRTPWRARPEGPGAWRQSLMRLPGARSSKNHAMRFDGPPSKYTLIPIDVVIGRAGDAANEIKQAFAVAGENGGGK